MHLFPQQTDPPPSPSISVLSFDISGMLGYPIDGLEEVDQQPGLQEVQICEWLSVCTENLYLTWTSDRKRTAVSTRTVSETE